MNLKSDLLLIEGKRNSSQLYYSNLLLKGFKVWLASNSEAVDDIYQANQPNVIIFNVPSFRTSGLRLTGKLVKKYGDVPMIIISDSQHEIFTTKSNIKYLTVPFTFQKLVNTIARVHPAESKNLLAKGPLKVDLMNNWVQIDQRKIQLTPQLVMLLSTLMAKPNETITREAIFTRVWETDYTADMRTLDVHISWLRKAIEQDPRHPQLIKTVRGVGYYFDPDGK